ncbi:MAG TPA: ATPase [Kiritimatiellia bacterium]|nr:ATPase [Kiritimatiellia bacterium]
MQQSTVRRFFAMGVALILISAFFALHPQGGQFLGARNLSNLSIELSITAVLALGMLLVLLPGLIDLSVGSGVGLLGGVAAVLIMQPANLIPGAGAGWSAPAALAVTLAVAVLVWTGMGALIMRFRIPAFIITLGGLLVFKGLHWAVIRNATVPVVPGGQENAFSLLTTYYLPPSAGFAACGIVALALAWSRWRQRAQRRQHGLPVPSATQDFLQVFVSVQVLVLCVLVMNQHKGLPFPLLVLGLTALLVQVLTRHTPFGRHLYAIGGNEEAARLSGINVNGRAILAFAVLGGIVALTGFMQTAYGGYSTTTVGNLMELDAIAACVIGGTSLKGGRGSVLGVLFGALIMAVLLNGMTLLAVSPEMKLIARGIVLVLAVWMDVVFAPRSA